jgi:hypothetical protein
MATKTEAPVLVASHPRSGTHLMIDLLRRQFASCAARVLPGQSFADLYLSLERFQENAHRPITEQRARGIVKRARRPTLKTHMLPSFERVPPAHREFVMGLVGRSDRIYCVRDGRSVMCSYRIFHDHGATPMSAFLRERVDGVSRAARWARHIRAWMAEPGVHLMRYEALVRSPVESVEKLGQILGERPLGRQPTLPPPLRTVSESRLSRLLGRSTSTAIVGKPLPGEAKKWQELFDESDRRFFHEEAGDLLIELGYEQDDAWVSAPAGATA